VQRTRAECINEFLAFVGELDDPLALALANTELLNALDTVAKAHTWQAFTSPAPFEMTLAVNQRSYAMPDYFARLQYFRLPNLTTGGHVDVIDKQVADGMYPHAGTSLEVPGRVSRAVIAGVVGVQTQPSSVGEAMELVSSSALDVGDVLVTIAGNDANGVWLRAQYTLNGLTAVPAGTWSYFDEFGKSYAHTATPPTAFTTSRGTVTLRKAGGGTTIQTLLPQESARQHEVITFYPAPASADIIAISFIRRPKRLLFDSDPLPYGWWPGVKEEMLIQWRINTGELARDAKVDRPKLDALIVNDNIGRPAPRIRPFTGF
jgi:hypothetical protein